jgi:hypothetical protein
MSNNIYDILKKMHDLEAPKQTLNEGKKAKPDYIDIDKDGNKTEPMKKAAKEKSKGAVAEAVFRVEQQLAGKYQGWKKINEEEMIRKVIPVGVIDGPGGYEQAQKRIKDYEDGKINKKGEPLPPIEDRSKPAEKPKTNVGRKEVDESGLQAYLGKKKYGEEGMRALQQAGREGASKEKMARIRAQHDKMDEDNQSDMKARDKASRAAEFEKDLEFVQSGGAHRDTSGVEYDRHGNPAFDVDTRRKLEKERTYPVYRHPGVGDGMPDRPVPGKMDEDSYNEDMLSPAQKKFAALAEPKDKITYADKIAGAKKGKKTEGNKFSGNLMKARAQGLKQADLDGDGDMERVTPGKSNMREGWEEMQKYLEKKRGPESKGGAGKKAGTRYGGSAQRDDDEETDGEGQAVVKKKGRPKGTGGGAKFNFKKPKD